MCGTAHSFDHWVGDGHAGADGAAAMALNSTIRDVLFCQVKITLH